MFKYNKHVQLKYQAKMSTTPNIDSAIRLRHLQQLLHKGYSSQLLFCEQLPPSIKIPALISCRMYYQATVQLLNEQPSSPLHLLWLIASSHMIQANYDEYYQKLTEEKDQKYKQLADDWIKMNKPLHHPPEIKALLRKDFEELLLLAQQQNYFANPKMPVFLVSCKWLQNLYNNNLNYIPAVDNSDLFSPAHWIETDPKYMHYNYELKESCRQNTDYKIVPFEAWQFLQSKFGGMEFRRFTTNQKQPICELTLSKVRIVIVQNRYLFGYQVFEILASRFDTIALLIERVKRILISYNIIQFQSLNSSWQPVLISHLNPEQLIDIIQDEEKDLIKLSSQNTYQMYRLEYVHDIEDTQYNYNSDIIMFNLEKNKKSFIDMHSIPYKKTTKKYNKCETCNTTQKLQQCVCKQVYFCCPEHRAKNKQHLKNCSNLMKQESIISRLVDFYGVHKRKYQFKEIRNGGKVGLQNLGNTCYMNAALQCVLSIDALSEFFVSNQHAKLLNVTNVLGSEGHLACAYGQLVKDYYGTNRRALQPVRILKIISSKNAQFRGFNHQDSQEFFNYFFDKLHQDLNRVRDKPYIQNIQSDGRPDEITSQLSWRNYLKRNNSFISDNFAGQYRSEIRCPDCDRISITFDPFLSLTFQFPKQVPTTEVTGYFLTNQGQFLKVKEKLISTMNSAQFVEKYFREPVIPIWLKSKQPQTQWKMKKSLGFNDNSKRILVFYPKPNNWNVQITYKYQDYDILHRKIFVAEVQNQQQLIKIMYQYLKVPLLKGTKKQELLQMSMQQYLKICDQNKFLEIVEKQQYNYPLKEGKINIKLKIIESKLPQNWALPEKLKFDISAKNYTSKTKLKSPRSIDEQLTIQDLIQSFSEPEQLTEENSWYCNKCKEHKLAQKIMSIYKVPKFLVIHLKRFNHRGNRYVIYGEKVKTPVKLFTTQTINGNKYTLFGVVNHYGSLTMGHYTAYVKRDQAWYYADDSSFKRKQPEGSGAYLLFYKRVE